MSIQGTPVQFQIINDADGSFNITIPGVQENESLFIQLSAYVPSLGTLAASDDKTNTWAIHGPSATQNVGIAANYSAFNCAVGDTVVTLSGFGAGCYIEGVAYRRNDAFVASPHDAAASNSANGQSATPSVTGPAACAQDNNVVLATVAVSDTVSDAGIDAPATTGYTNLKVVQDAITSIGHSADYKDITNGTSGAQSAAWGTLATGADDWTARLDVFKLSDAAQTTQEGTRFGNDDGSESAHTFAAAQDANITAPLDTNILLRAIIDTAGDLGATAFNLRYQKNGSGGYVQIPVGTTSKPPPLIEAADCTVSGNNTAQTSWAVTRPAYSSGDLLIIYIAWDDSTDCTDVTEPAGPNSETLVEIITTPITDNSTETRAKAWYYVATAAAAAGSYTFTPAATESWSATVIRVPAGEFDPTTPIGAIATAAATAVNDSTVDSPAFTAGASDGNGRLVWCASVDTDPLLTLESGWTSRQTQDLGAVAHGVATRDAVVTDSESIASATWTIAGDSWTSIAFIVRAPTITNQIYIATSSNIAAGGEATTARLTPPGSKTTSDFTTGRRWDDENGADTIDIVVDDYTEVEWCLRAQSPAVNDDFFDLRVYAGSTPLTTYGVTPRWTIGASGIQGSSSSAYDSVTGSATGSTPGSIGNSSSAYDTFTGSATGSLAGSIGDSSSTYEAVTGSATSSVPSVGTSSSAYDSITGSATGTVVAGASPQADDPFFVQLPHQYLALLGYVYEDVMWSVNTSIIISLTEITGSSNQPYDDVVGSAAGSVAGPVANSTASYESITGSATGTELVQGNSSQSITDITGSAAGVISAPVGDSSISYNTLTGVAEGTVGSVPSVGDSSVAYSSITGSATGGVFVQGNSVQGYGAITGSATGQVSSAVELIHESLDLNFVSYQAYDVDFPTDITWFTNSAALVLSVISGSSSSAYNSVSGSASGTVSFTPVVGNSSQSYATISGSATGTFPILAVSNLTIGPITGTATGFIPAVGDSNQNFATISGSATGSVNSIPVIGDSVQVYDSISGSAAGVITTSDISGSSTQSYNSINGSATGTVPVLAESNLTIGPITGVATGFIPVVGNSILTIDVITGFADGTLGPNFPILGQSIASYGPVNGSALGGSEWVVLPNHMKLSRLTDRYLLKSYH